MAQRGHKTDKQILPKKTVSQITSGLEAGSYQGETLYVTDEKVVYVFDGTSFLPVVGYETVTNIDNSDSPYTVSARDRNIRVDTSAGAVTINLPAATGSGRRLDIKIIDATNATTIDGNSSETIDGLTTLVLSSLYDNASLQDVASGEWDIK